MTLVRRALMASFRAVLRRWTHSAFAEVLGALRRTVFFGEPGIRAKIISGPVAMERSKSDMGWGVSGLLSRLLC